MPRPIILRLAPSALLVICAIVVLGISAHVESSIRLFGVSTSTYTFGAFVGAFTVVVELVLAIARWFRISKLDSLVVDVACSAIVWVLWLATGITTTKVTEEDRSFCKNLDSLTLDPELADLDPALLDVATKAFKRACSELHADLAFIWIAFLASTGITVWMVFYGMSKQKKLGKAVWYRNIASMGTGTSNPFEDFESNAPGLSVGVAGPEDEEDVSK